MKKPLFGWLAFAFVLLAVTCRAATNPEIVSLGHDTYSLTRWAKTGFTRDTDKLKAQALEDAAAYCAKLKKELKVISTTGERPTIPLTGFASAKIVFKALAPSDPELRTPVPAAVASGAEPAVMAVPAPAPVVEGPPARISTDQLYNDLVKLDDLRKRGLITDEDFQAQKKKLLEKAN